jgi:hypothetical protein
MDNIMLSLRFLLPLVCLCFASCVGTYYHAREGVWGLGYSDTRISPDSWRVMYRGYSIPEAQAADFSLLRAADLMKAAGYPYFVVMNEKSSVASQGAGFGYLQAGTGSMASATVSYPESNILVKGLMSKPKDSTQMVYDTDFISSEIRRKYHVQGRTAQ